MDIKNKRKRTVKKNAPEPDLSFLNEAVPQDVQEIEQPQHLTYKLGTVFKQRSVMEAVMAILLFGAGLALGAQFLAPEPEPIKIVTVPSAVEPAVEAQQVAGDQDSIFPPDVYHKIELVTGDVYYSLIAESDGKFYRLANVFYTIEESADLEGPPKITLAMYEQVADQPAGELLLPYEQVKAVSRLHQTSSIVTAIEQYLAQQPVAEEENPEN